MNRTTVNRDRRSWPIAEQVEYQRERISRQEEVIADLLHRLHRERNARTTAKRQLSKLLK